MKALKRKLASAALAVLDMDAAAYILDTIRAG